MTLQNIIEIVKESFPDKGEPRIIKEIDLAQKTFVEETDITKDRAALSGLSSGVSFDLPSGYLKVKRVDFLDSNNKVIDHPLIYNIEFDKITFDATDYDITVIPSSIAKIIINYVPRPADITSRSDSFTIPQEFIPAIEAKVMERFYALFPTITTTDKNGNSIMVKDWNAVHYWVSIYDKYRIEAKKYVNMIDSTTPYITGSVDNYTVTPQVVGNI